MGSAFSAGRRWGLPVAFNGLSHFYHESVCGPNAPIPPSPPLHPGPPFGDTGNPWLEQLIRRQPEEIRQPVQILELNLSFSC
jgi:hypothetical protein